VTLTTDEGPVLDTAVPVFEGRAGQVRVGLSERRAQATIDALTGQLLLTTVLVSAVGVAFAGLLTWLLARPIQQLARVARQIGRGDFSPRVQRWADDEIGELADAFNAMATGLQEAEQERQASERLQAQYVKGVITAQEDERKRIARELHDSTSQSLTSLLIGLRALGASADGDTQRHAEELRTVAAHTLDEVHSLALQLRPSVLDDLGLAAAIERYVADCRRHAGLEIDLAMRGLERRLPPEVETALYRIIQESLTNVLRHAHAQTASVIVERRDGAVRAIVEDDGCGFDPATAGRREQRLGLYGMRERAELLNGRVEIESAPGQGTSVMVEIPLGREDGQPDGRAEDRA
jgi:signal transduction histidine kinase